MCADPKSVKIQSSSQYLFALLESLRKMLVKLTPAVNFIKVLLESFFVRKSFWPLISNYILAKKTFGTKNSREKCW